jgi:formate hydrogenlyase subunit 3/multisubunit Na+/H+ antiporter MnhD subunit
MSLLQLVVVPLAVGVFSLVFLAKWKRVQWVLFFFVSLFQLYGAVALFGRAGAVETMPLSLALPGLSSSTLTLRMGGLSYLFFAASSLVTFLIAVYSMSYNDKKHATGIAPLWTMLLGASAGIFFAGDWIVFLFSWELMGWTSYFIIAHGRRGPREAALYYYILSLVGTATLLAAVFITASGSGSLLIGEGIAYLAGLWGTHNGLVSLVVLFFTVTFFAKSAVFPFYMWPSKAHAEAPDDFSSFLSGVMIKYGVFGMIALVLPVFRNGYAGPAINGVPLYLAVLGWLGVITAVVGTLYAIPQDDMKRLMAYSTVSHVGFITAAFSMNSAIGIAAALFHTINHMMFKGGIFLSMGSVKYRTGERMMHRLGGMGYRMPLSFFTFLVCIIAAAGIPPMSGFASKWLVYQSIFGRGLLIMAVPAFFASTGSFLYLYRGLHTIYLGQLSPRFSGVKEAPGGMAVAMFFTMMIVMVTGFFPGTVLIPVNAALAELGLEPLTLNLFMIQGVTTSLNLTLIGILFMGAVFIVGFLYVIGKRRELVAPLDTYTAGEDPDEWGLTAERYHYGMSFYEPFEAMTGPLLRGSSLDALFQKIGTEFGKLSENLKRWFNTPQLGTIFIVVVLIVVILAVWR